MSQSDFYWHFKETRTKTRRNWATWYCNLDFMLSLAANVERVIINLQRFSLILMMRFNYTPEDFASTMLPQASPSISLAIGDGFRLYNRIYFPSKFSSPKDSSSNQEPRILESLPISCRIRIKLLLKLTDDFSCDSGQRLTFSWKSAYNHHCKSWKKKKLHTIFISFLEKLRMISANSISVTP